MKVLAKVFAHIISIFISTSLFNRKLKKRTFFFFVLNNRRSFFSIDGLWKRAYRLSLKNNGYKLGTIKNSKRVNANSIIIWRPNQGMLKKEIRHSLEASKAFKNIAKSFIKKGCIVYPSEKDLAMFENKIEMYDRFKMQHISHPRTYTCNNKNELFLVTKELSYPFILKGPFSYSSRQISKIDNQNELIEVEKKIKSFDHVRTNEFRYPIIIQEYINIKRDLRVIIVGEEIIEYYWRINCSREWKPTATSFKSKVLFRNFPLKWKNFIIEEFKKMELPWGGLDIAWENDDLQSIPKILEVSPCFDPNPPPPKKLMNNYYKFKYSKFNSFRYNYRKWYSISKTANHQIKYVLDSLK